MPTRAIRIVAGSAIREGSLAPKSILLILVAREQPDFDDLAALNADEIHAGLLEFDAAGLTSELQVDGDPIPIGHEMIGTCDCKRSFGDFHHFAQHWANRNHALMRA